MTERMECLECGGEIGTSSIDQFCCKEHRLKFDTRRLTRGVLLYDSLMGAKAKKMGGERFLMLAGGLVQGFREQDKKERNGRRSWRDIKKV